jgi:hypothetical protein
VTVEEYEARFERNTAVLHEQLSRLRGATGGGWTRRSRWIATAIAGLALAGFAFGAGWVANDEAPKLPNYIAPDWSILFGP